MDNIQSILDKVVSAVSVVSGIQAAVLGGSRARGTHTLDSDIDIGLYYDAAALDLPALEKAAQTLDDEHRSSLIAPPGAWGQWVNGGGWLLIDGYHVDFILRDVTRVEASIQECQKGNVTAHYQTGHPHAYLNAMYMGELAVCRVLWSRNGALSALKHVAETYPPALKTALLGFFGFEAGFSHMFAQASADKNDVYYVTAHLVRAVSALNQVLFALNETYCINEKKAVAMIDSLPLCPSGYGEKIRAIFAEAGVDTASACRRLKHLIDEVDALRTQG